MTRSCDTECALIWLGKEIKNSIITPSSSSPTPVSRCVPRSPKVLATGMPPKTDEFPFGYGRSDIHTCPNYQNVVATPVKQNPRQRHVVRQASGSLGRKASDKVHLCSIKEPIDSLDIRGEVPQTSTRTTNCFVGQPNNVEVVNNNSQKSSHVAANPFASTRTVFLRDNDPSNVQYTNTPTSQDLQQRHLPFPATRRDFEAHLETPQSSRSQHINAIGSENFALRRHISDNCCGRLDRFELQDKPSHKKPSSSGRKLTWLHEERNSDAIGSCRPPRFSQTVLDDSNTRPALRRYVSENHITVSPPPFLSRHYSIDLDTSRLVEHQYINESRQSSRVAVDKSSIGRRGCTEERPTLRRNLSDDVVDYSSYRNHPNRWQLQQSLPRHCTPEDVHFSTATRRNSPQRFFSDHVLDNLRVANDGTLGRPMHSESNSSRKNQYAGITRYPTTPNSAERKQTRDFAPIKCVPPVPQQPSHTNEKYRAISVDSPQDVLSNDSTSLSKSSHSDVDSIVMSNHDLHPVSLRRKPSLRLYNRRNTLRTKSQSDSGILSTRNISPVDYDMPQGKSEDTTRINKQGSIHANRKGLSKSFSMHSIIEEKSHEKRIRSSQKPIARLRVDSNRDIEVAPGIFAHLRGAEETWNAITTGYASQYECGECAQRFCAIRDASYFICPSCKCIGTSGFQSTHGGVGLGLNVEFLWPREVEEIQRVVGNAPRLSSRR